MSRFRTWWSGLKGWERFLMIALVACATKWGGSKHVSGKVSVADDYIADNGSYLTNDVAYIALQKKSALLPDSIEILVYARELASTNTADWFRLEPYLTYADHPYAYSLPNATNYYVIVAANYAAPPSVHTNGVLLIKGFIIPGTDKVAFPNSRIKEVP